MILSIISGTFNRLPYLTAMVESARRSLPPNFACQYEFVIVDGGSTDGSLEWMHSQPDIRTIEHGELKGAIRAFNDAGAAACGTYLCVANDDVIFQDYTLARGLAFMMDNPDVGAGCFFQDRNGKEMHVEHMPIMGVDGVQGKTPYLQVGLIPKWLWDACGGWGNWPGCRTYGGDNYLSGRVLEHGYRIVAIEGTAISDKTPQDALRKQNNAPGSYGTPVWEAFPNGFQAAPAPTVPNPIPEMRRVLYAPIIEAGHVVQKEQKRGLRDALGALGVVWEVDYQFSGESIAEAAKAWQPHLTLTQFHTAATTSAEEAKVLRACCSGPLLNFSGDVWSDQASPEFLEILRYYDLQLTVNAGLLPKYQAIGIRAVYWQNSNEPQIIEDIAPDRFCDVIFVGNNYHVEGAVQSRQTLAFALKDMAPTVHIYGRGYPGNLAEGESLYNFRHTGTLYRGAKIAIADNQFFEATGFASDRMFMVLAAGGCALFHQRVDKMEELLGLKAGVHYVEWITVEDLKTKIAYYLAHLDELTAIAAAGTAECRAHHSFPARVEQLKTLIAAIPKKRNTISAMMIVKDEAKNIETNLAQLREFADEIIIVDTGSTDGTLAKLCGDSSDLVALGRPVDEMADPGLLHRAGTLSVYSFPWVEDFSAARNFAKSKCTCDWIFWMDADDRIASDMVRDLKMKWPWKIRSQGITNIQAAAVWYQGGEEGSGCMQTRLFRNIPNIEWRKNAMETLDESLRELGIEPAPFASQVIRHLEEKNPAVQERKQMKYAAMLKRDPPSLQRDFQIAHCFMSAGRWGDAFLHFSEVRRQLESEDIRSFIAFAMGYAAWKLDLVGVALPWLEKSDFADAYYVRFLLDETRFDLLQKFLDAPLSPVFPTFARLWRSTAQQRLLNWHSEELAGMLEVSMNDRQALKPFEPAGIPETVESAA